MVCVGWMTPPVSAGGPLSVGMEAVVLAAPALLAGGGVLDVVGSPARGHGGSICSVRSRQSKPNIVSDLTFSHA